MGLLKTAATVAVASSVHGRVQRRQQARWAVQDQAATGMHMPPQPGMYAAPPQSAYDELVPPQAATTPGQSADNADRIGQLKQLGELLSSGVLTQAEFDVQKARILNS